MANTQVQAGLDIPFAGRELLRSLAENWWLLLRGVAAIIFGMLAFFCPDRGFPTPTRAAAVKDGPSSGHRSSGAQRP